MLLIMYGFCEKCKYQDYIHEASMMGTKLSDRTIADWNNYCREICMVDLDQNYENQGKIGGETHVVLIDEAKIGKRKYHIGRIVEGQWILSNFNKSLILTLILT